MSEIILFVTLDCWSLHWGKTDLIQFTPIVWRRVWDPPSNLGPQVPIFQFLNIIVCRRLEPLFYRQPPLWPSPLFTFFPNTLLLARLFQWHCPNEIPEKHENKLMWQSFSIFRIDLKTMLNAFSFLLLICPSSFQAMKLPSITSINFLFELLFCFSFSLIFSGLSYFIFIVLPFQFSLVMYSFVFSIPYPLFFPSQKD